MKYVDISKIDVEYGAITEVPFVQIVGALFARGAVGLLRLSLFNTEKGIYFLDGMPVYVRSNLSGESLGNILVKKGVIKREDVEEATRVMKREKMHEGEAFVKMG